MNTVDINFSEFGQPIKLIIIDPKKFKSRYIEQQKAKEKLKPQTITPKYRTLPLPRTTTNNNVPNWQQQQQFTPPPQENNPTTIPASEQGSKIRNNSENEVTITTDEEEEEDDRNEQNYLTSEQITRVGRVTKKPKLFIADKPNQTPPSSVPPTEKVRKRRLSEKFRCKTCLKYYVGDKNLKMHYKKFADHKPKEDPPSQPPVPVQVHQPIPEPQPDIIVLKSCNSVAVQVNDSDFFQPPPNSLFQPLQIETDSHHLTLMGHDDGKSPSPKQRRLNPITVPLTSGNVLSPGENSLSAAMATLNEDEFELTTTFRKVAATTISADSLDSTHHHGVIGVFTTSLPPTTLTTSVNSTNATSEPICSPTVSPITVNPIPRMMTSTPIPPSSPSDDNMSLCGNGNCNNGQSASPTKRGKLIWEFIEEKLIREGVNQILTEISDVAERLSKIARDKIIPIREEEEERLQSTVPIIQVDTPFLSHLLDVPFGTYIFKEDDEDSERRQPSATELSQLSLTSVSAEVDIDKFLSPDLVLPHLTNLDFNSICNQ